MSIRFPALALFATMILGACTDQPPPTAPRGAPPKPTLAIDADVACGGLTMPAIECQALVALYNSTNGPGWTSVDDWGVEPNPCTWEGVTCTQGDFGSVKILDLTARKLTGPIPAALGNLQALEVLDLGFNDLTGTLPAELGNLPNLERLDVDSNELTGPLPASLGNNQSIETLYLARSHFTGSIPPELGNLVNLTVLDLDLNELTGTIPPELGNLSKLEFFSLSRNQLTGSIPPELGNLASVAYFGLWGNELSGLVPLSVAQVGSGITCDFQAFGNEGLYMPDAPAYREADEDGDGEICSVGFTPADDIGEDAVEDIDDLVPAVINEGQANALETKIENAMEKAAKGQYAAAINQMQSFIGQLNGMVADGILTPAQAEPFIDQAESLIAIWSGML